MKRFSFIILHYLEIEDSIKCIDSILSLDNTDNEINIYIVDNGSHNGSLEKLKEKFATNENIAFIMNESNLGFAKGNNVGYKAAKEHGADFIIILNSDIVIKDKDFLNRVLLSYERVQYYIMGPDIITLKGVHQNPIDGNYDVLRCKKIIKTSRLMYFLEAFGINSLRRKLGLTHTEKNGLSYEKKKSQENVALHGAFLVFSPLFIKFSDIAFFPNTFLYMEENILYYLCQKHDMKTFYDGDIEVIHTEDASSKLMVRSERKRMMFTFKNQRESAIEFLKLMYSDARLNVQSGDSK